ncbi:hypothetical protein G6F68_021524 [Rhizopus microsporus]|nr:hypothetical protein G6F68_021524 [Rhizopus microsporus]
MARGFQGGDIGSRRQKESDVFHRRAAPKMPPGKRAKNPRSGCGAAAFFQTPSIRLPTVAIHLQECRNPLSETALNPDTVTSAGIKAGRQRA